MAIAAADRLPLPSTASLPPAGEVAPSITPAASQPPVAAADTAFEDLQHQETYGLRASFSSAEERSVSFGRKARHFAREHGFDTADLPAALRRRLDLNRNGKVNRDELASAWESYSTAPSGGAAGGASFSGYLAQTYDPLDRTREMGMQASLVMLGQQLTGAERDLLGMAPLPERTGWAANLPDLRPGAGDWQLRQAILGALASDSVSPPLGAGGVQALRAGGGRLSFTLAHAVEIEKDGLTFRLDRNVSLSIAADGTISDVRGLRVTDGAGVPLLDPKIRALRVADGGMYVRTGKVADRLAGLLGYSPQGSDATAFIPFTRKKQ
ncbi:MAG: hypothetical protein HYV63_12185 [Candidatus Schekmanbacteria bacterium]|nr:hypothetical protein [Candidatus Schekmanbacteria bacterium]